MASLEEVWPFLEEACHWGWALSFKSLMPGPVSLSAVCGSVSSSQLLLQSDICHSVPNHDGNITSPPIKHLPF